MGEDQRRHQRLGVALDMRVRGVDVAGLSFDEATLSNDVSRGGCSFHLTREVALGAQMELEIYRRPSPRRPPTPFLTEGVVLRIVKLGNDEYTVSVEFTGPQ